MHKYEITFIVRPDIPEEELDKLIAQMEGVATSAGGQVEKVEKVGRRRLAYRVLKYREGLYILFHVQGGGDTVREFERRLKVTDTVIKYLTVRMDEELERAEKFKALRARQETRRRRPKTPATSGPPQPSSETAQT
jgi:small subunit ribosomal protein S6